MMAPVPIPPLAWRSAAPWVPVLQDDYVTPLLGGTAVQAGAGATAAAGQAIAVSPWGLLLLILVVFFLFRGGK